MAFGQKGILSAFTIVTSLITGSGFPLLGSFYAAFFIDKIFVEGLILTCIGGFIAHYFMSHSIHDLFHYDIEKRFTFSKTTLKIMLVLSVIILLVIMVYLAFQSGWPVIVFAIIGAITTLYAEGLLHHESQMAFGAMFLVIGAFYVQLGYSFDFDMVFEQWEAWLEVLLLSLFAFFSQYGWLLFYRLDDYDWNPKMRNFSILVTKLGLVFLIAVFGVHVLS